MVREVPGEHFRWYVECRENIFDGTWGAGRTFSMVRGVPREDSRWYVGCPENIFDGTGGPGTTKSTFSMVRRIWEPSKSKFQWYVSKMYH